MEFRVVLVDDEPPARNKLRHLLSGQRDFTVVGEAGSVEEAQVVVGQVEPDVVFLDIQLGERSGFELVAGDGGGRDLSQRTANRRWRRFGCKRLTTC